MPPSRSQRGLEFAKEGRPEASATAESFRRSDAEAVGAVRQRVRKILSFRGFRMTAEDRKDLEQEVMVKLWQAVNREGFDTTGNFWGFVEVVTARRCIDWLRVAKSTAELADDVVDRRRDPLSRALRGEQRHLAQQVLRRLSGPCRELIYLHVGLEKNYREISEILGKSEGALRVQMYRCVRQARKVMRAVTGDGESTTAAGRASDGSPEV